MPEMLATGGFEKKLRIFDLASSGAVSGSSASSPTNGDGTSGKTDATSYEIGAGVHGGTIKSVVWSPDSNLVITAADDKIVRWWDLRTSRPVGSYQLDGPLGTCELNSVNKWKGPNSTVLSVAAGKSAYFFSDTEPGRVIKIVKTPHDIASVAVHWDENKFVVGGSGDTYVRVYSLDEGKELALHKGHHGPIWSTGFSPDGKLYATGSEDGTIKLWKFCKDAYGLWR
jgi:serine-threonine kinase receptor-associated protein